MKAGNYSLQTVKINWVIGLAIIVGFLISLNARAQCITVYPHVEDFETAPTWTAVTAPTSSVAGTCDWTWGTPNHTYVIKSAGSGSKCWCAGGLTGSFYKFNQESYIYSPCYDFTNLQYPFIQFKLFYDLEYKYDGGNLQSSINGGTSWQDVGGYNDPADCNTANWYNYNSIKFLNQPAGFVTSKTGWCGNVETGGTGWDPTNTGVNCVGGNGSGKWVTAKHCLTGLAGQPNVIFRFTLGAGYTCNDFDGLAIDSVAVGNGVVNTTTITSVCNGNTLTFSSGAKACPTTTWAWNFGDGATSTIENPAHTYAGPGIYTVSVIASGGACNPPDTSKKIVHILSVSISSFTNATCANPGAAVAIASGASTPSYSWSNGATTANVSGLNAGTYTVTVLDAANPSACPTNTTVTITQPNPIVITLSSTPSSCNSSNGSATATSVTGGTGAGTYTYSWSPSGGTGTTASNLTAGLYSLTVTDANACKATQTIQVNNSSGPQVSVSSHSISCNGGNNGSITVTATGGTAPITYSWSTVGVGPASQSNLVAGTYTVITTDASPCAVTNVITLNQPTAITSVTSNTAATCGQTNGMASVVVSGGTPAYTYSWSPSGGNTSHANGLGFGTYTVSGVDANGCIYSAQTTVVQQSAVNVSVSSTAASCGNNNGTTSSHATGGFPGHAGYTYTWSPSGGNASAASNLAPGVYTVIVGDSLGCVSSKTITVANHISPALNTSVGNITCFGSANGTASVSILAGTGTAPFTYTWSPMASNASSINNLAPGSYTVNVTDSFACTASSTVSIVQPPALTVTASGTQATCGRANGSATCTASGGSPGYTYLWSPMGGNAATAANLTGNTTYTVTLKDANNCLDTASVFVASTPAVTLSVPTTTNVTCNGGSDGMISVTGGGGTPVISYTWEPAGGNNATAVNLSASVTGTTYTLYAQDIIGCRDSVTATIKEPSPIVMLTAGQTICKGQSAMVSATANGGNGGVYSYTWAPSGTTGQNLNVTPATTTVYTVIAADGKGCLGMPDTASVIVLSPLLLTVSTNDTVCPGTTAHLYVTSQTGGLGLGHYTVTWLPGGSTGDTLTAHPTGTTTYTAVLSDWCTVLNDTTKGVVYTYPLPVIGYTATPIAGCAPLTASFSPAGVNNIVANSWFWSFGDGSTSSAPNGTTYTYFYPGVYHPVLHGTTTNGCPDSSGVVDTIHVYPQPHADFTASTFETDVYDNTIYFTDLSAGGQASNLWTFIGQNFTTTIQNPKYTFFPEGTYLVKLYVVNQYGCKDSITKEIIINPIFTFYAPNCVTPNGDGINENFLPEGTGWDNNQYNLWIFDRWGIMIHHTTDPYQGWNGKRNDHVVQEDTYVWKVDLSDVFGKPHQYHGQVSVVR